MKKIHAFTILAASLSLFSPLAIADAVVTPSSDDWGQWGRISSEQVGKTALTWFSKGGAPKSEAKDLLFVSQGSGSVADLAEAQRAAAFLLKMQCEGARINAPEPRIDGATGVAYVQTYCDSDSEFKSGVVAFRKIIVNNGTVATIVRLWRVPIGEARNITSSSIEYIAPVIKERGAVSKYMSEQIALCKQEADPNSCVR